MAVFEDEPAQTEALDCRSCGACCHGRAGTILVSEQSLLRFRQSGRSDIAERLTPGHFEKPALPMRGSACAFLGTQANVKDCSIYEIRPDTCRDFEVGGRQCLEARRIYL